MSQNAFSLSSEYLLVPEQVVFALVDDKRMYSRIITFLQDDQERKYCLLPHTLPIGCDVFVEFAENPGESARIGQTVSGGDAFPSVFLLLEIEEKNVGYHRPYEPDFTTNDLCNVSAPLWRLGEAPEDTEDLAVAETPPEIAYLAGFNLAVAVIAAPEAHAEFPPELRLSVANLADGWKDKAPPATYLGLELVNRDGIHAGIVVGANSEEGYLALAPRHFYRFADNGFSELRNLHAIEDDATSKDLRVAADVSDITDRPDELDDEDVKIIALFEEVQIEDEVA